MHSDVTASQLAETLDKPKKAKRFLLIDIYTTSGETLILSCVVITSTEYITTLFDDDR